MDQVLIKIKNVLHENGKLLHDAWYYNPSLVSGTGPIIEMRDNIYTGVAKDIIKELGLSEEYLNSMEDG